MSALELFTEVTMVVYVPEALLSVGVAVDVLPEEAVTITIRSLTLGAAPTVCVPELVSNVEPKKVTVRAILFLQVLNRSG